MATSHFCPNLAFPGTVLCEAILHRAGVRSELSGKAEIHIHTVIYSPHLKQVIMHDGTS